MFCAIWTTFSLLQAEKNRKILDLHMYYYPSATRKIQIFPLAAVYFDTPYIMFIGMHSAWQFVLNS